MQSLSGELLLGPIFNRELLTIPRRGRSHFIRSLYLALLWTLALTAWQTAYGWGKPYTPADLAFFGTLVFQLLSVLQLVLVLFFASLLAAGSVTQEKDRRTFVLLLMTDLRDSEIVLGKLFGSLLRIGALVLSAMPVLGMTMLLGGVSFAQVVLAFVVLACTALAAGAAGLLVALWREKTFQTLALTVLFLVLYLILVQALRIIPGLEDWQIYVDPVRALLGVIDARGGAAWWQSPVLGFAGVMVGLTGVLTAVGIWKLRVWNPSGEPIQHREAAEDEPDNPEKRARAHAAPGAVRSVWANPLLWREIRTRAYGRRTLLIKLAYFLILGLILYYVVSTLPAASVRGLDRFAPAWGLVPVVVISLLLLNAQAVTSITSERDLKSLDLLLVTDLSPREFVFGKLGGICYNLKEVILAPLLLAIAYGVWGYFTLETLAFVFITLVVLIAFTAVLGVHVALRNANSRLSIGYSLGTIFFLFVGTLLCIYLITVSGRFEYQWTSFVVFLAVGIGGLYLVLSGDRPSYAIFLSSLACPLGIFYAITNVLIGNPATGKAGDPFWPFLVVSSAFGFTIAAMLVPLLSEFDVAFDYTAPADE